MARNRRHILTAGCRSALAVVPVPYYVTILAKRITSEWSVSNRLDPSHGRVGDGRPQQLPGGAAGASLPLSTSSMLTGSDGIPR